MAVNPEPGSSPEPGTRNPEPDPADYCRQIEAYLCRKNEGHLIRIVGPVFEQVCRWAEKGVPLKVAFRGIDRYFERYYARGPRRRPVQVQFCEADVLDVFDEWRRAVGVGMVAPASSDEGESSRRHGSLPAHLERVIARLTTLRTGDPSPLNEAIDAAVRELDLARAGARGLRGEGRERFLQRLRALEGELLTMARSQLGEQELTEVHAEADAELAPFRDRMPTDAYRQSHAACVDRIVRDRVRLPTIAFE